MAQPISDDIVRKIPSLDEQWEEFKARLLADEDTIQALLRLAQAAHEAGVLPFLTGLLEQKNSVLHLLVEEINQDGVKKAINNIEQLAALWGTISQDTLHTVLDAMNQGLERMAQSSESGSTGGMGFFQILSYLKNPDVAQGMRTLFAFLEGFGKTLSSTQK